MADTREVRTFATEVKFLVEPSVGAGIREWARAHLDADPHGTGPSGDQYLITTVYFDTDGLDVFHRRASFGRSKYRIRRYGDGLHVFLERKLRRPTVLAKRRTVAPMAALERLDPGSPAGPWSGRWFHARIEARRLRPVCQVSYNRTARLSTTGGDIIRLTLDEGLVALPSSEARFRDGAGLPLMGSRQILELKFRHHAPVLFKQLVEEFGLTPQPASKYRLGMAALGRAGNGHAPAAEDPAADGEIVHV